MSKSRYSQKIKEFLKSSSSDDDDPHKLFRKLYSRLCIHVELNKLKVYFDSDINTPISTLDVLDHIMNNATDNNLETIERYLKRDGNGRDLLIVLGQMFPINFYVETNTKI